MSMSKRLYLNFSFILGMVVVLFVVTWAAVRREHSAKAAASQALQMVDNTDKVRFQIMQNRLYLSNYLLSGDNREVQHMNEGVQTLQVALGYSQRFATSDEQRAAITAVQKNEEAWAGDSVGAAGGRQARDRNDFSGCLSPGQSVNCRGDRRRPRYRRRARQSQGDSQSVGQRGRSRTYDRPRTIGPDLPAWLQHGRRNH